MTRFASPEVTLLRDLASWKKLNNGTLSHRSCFWPEGDLAGRGRLVLCSPRSRARCAAAMYRRAVLALSGRLAGSRYADLACRRISVGSVLRCEKSPPENNGAGKPSAEAEDSEAPSSPPEQESLAGMFKAVKEKTTNRQSQENTGDIESASGTFQMAAEESHLDEQKLASEELADSASAEVLGLKLLQHLHLHKKMSKETRRKRSDTIRVPWSEKSAPEDSVGKRSGDAEDTTTLPHDNESSKQAGLAGLLGHMSIDVSSKKKLWARKEKTTVESASRMFQMVMAEGQPDEEKLVSRELADAASAVASTYPSKQKEVQSDLLQQLRLHKQMAEEIRSQESATISKVVSGMKLRKVRPKVGNQAEEWAFMKDTLKESLFAGKRLNIFSAPARSKTPAVTETTLSLWDLELAREIASIYEDLPRNGFEEMIQWTNEGKLWTFPIDNEAGLDEEQKVEFHEHIFLDKYLEDFPKQGPIRHFMELVICGLSKNPYLTVQQKKDHIDWFHDYFHEKENLLKECDIYIN